MHEMSLMQSLLQQVAQICEENDAQRATAIHIELGPLSGVEPLLLSCAFEQLATGTVAESAELNIDNVPLAAECRKCSATFELSNFHFVCPYCAATSIRVTQGDECRLLSVTVESHATSVGATS